MSTTEQKDAFIRETRELMAMPPEQRFKYVNEIIQGLASGFKNAMNANGKLNQMKLAKQLFKEIDDKATTLLPPIIYTIKPEFQPVFVRLIQEMAASMPKL